MWSIYSLQGILWGMIPPAIAFIAWYWPRKEEAKKELSSKAAPHKLVGMPASVPRYGVGDALDVAELPSYGFSHRSPDVVGQRRDDRHRGDGVRLHDRHLLLPAQSLETRRA
jgi:hypothetical protein